MGKKTAVACPDCGANLIHKQVLSGTVLQEISGDKVKLLTDSTTTDTHIFCSVNEMHNIPDDVKSAATELIEIKGL